MGGHGRCSGAPARGVLFQAVKDHQEGHRYSISLSMVDSSNAITAKVY